MIKLHSPLQIEVDPEGGWQLVLWVGDPFDYDISFRHILRTITEALGQDGMSSLQLPIFEPDEDFIEGKLCVGEVQLRTYYEHALGYLALMHDSEECLKRVATKLQHHVTLVSSL